MLGIPVAWEIFCLNKELQLHLTSEGKGNVVGDLVFRTLIWFSVFVLH